MSAPDPNASDAAARPPRWPLVLAFAIAGLVLFGLLVLAVPTLVGGGNNGYLVRAVFDNSSFVVTGEDVKIAGVKVGTIQALDVTPDNKAALILNISDPAFIPFRADAHCEIGLQSLIGEQFIQCTPTQPRSEATPLPPPLSMIKSGPGQGQYLLPVQNTSTPVGVDLLNDIQRVPEQLRFRLIINELGAGLASNGDELRAAIRRADPALQLTDHVIGVLASEDRLLGQLVDDSDTDLAPLAAERVHLGGFIQHAGETAVASAERGADIARNFQLFPPFLRQLKPAADRFSALADQMTPALQVLGAHAATVNQATEELGPFSKASTPALLSLGKVAQRGRQVFPEIKPLAIQFGTLATLLRPLAQNIANVASSFDNTGGIEDVMRFIYFYGGSVNGEDALGHYIRGGAEIGACSARDSQPAGGCESTFLNTSKGTAQSATIPNAPNFGGDEPPTTAAGQQRLIDWFNQLGAAPMLASPPASSAVAASRRTRTASRSTATATATPAPTPTPATATAATATSAASATSASGTYTPPGASGAAATSLLNFLLGPGAPR